MQHFEWSFVLLSFKTADLNYVQKKTPTYIFFHIFMCDV